MKILTKKVYYCDFCKKHALRSLKQHEKYCTGNLNRECRICSRKPDARPTLKVLVRYFKKQIYIPPKSESGGIPADQIKTPKIEDIMDRVDNCPACALTIIRALKLQNYPFDIRFDYKKEVETWWAEKNRKDMEDEMHYEIYG